MNCKSYRKKIIKWLIFPYVLFIIFIVNSCSTKKVSAPVFPDTTINQLFYPAGIEEIIKEPDGDIMEFDISPDSRYIAYSTNAYKKSFQVLLMDFKENKKQYLMPEDTEQLSPRIYGDDLYFIRIDKGNSFLTNYNIKQNLFKTIFKVNNTILTLSADYETLSFAVNDKGIWKIWLLQDNKFILVDNGFYPHLSHNIIYYQKPNEKGSQYYSIFAMDLATNTKYSILYHSAKSYLNPSLSKNGKTLSYVEFSNDTYYLKLLNLKNNHQYTLLKSKTPLLSPNLKVEGYIYFIFQQNGKFAIYRLKI